MLPRLDHIKRSLIAASPLHATLLRFRALGVVPQGSHTEMMLLAFEREVGR